MMTALTATASRPAGTVCLFLLSSFALLTSGCAVVDVGVSNPLPQVRRVAIAPFLNLSLQPDLDVNSEELKSGTFTDRRFAQAYFAELQKTPGFEAIPVGVVEQAIIAGRLPMNGPEDYLATADAIGADAICIGAVTDFDPYHPRLGLQVNWYSATQLIPPAPIAPYERSNAIERYLPAKRSLLPFGRKRGRLLSDPYCVDGETIRGQSPGQASPGETRPRVGCCQRTSASRPTSAPVSVATTG